MKISYITIPLAVLLMAGCTDTETTSPTQDTTEQATQQNDSTSKEVTTNKDMNQSSEQTYEEWQRLFLMTLEPTRSETEYGNRTACDSFPSDRAVPLCSMFSV